MIYADAIAATRHPAPITRTTSDGYEMRGYLDGSVDVYQGKRLAKRLGPHTGPALGYTDWQEGQ